MSEQEIPLVGGNKVTQVVKIGKTVHRSMGQWSPSVHDLLTYLEKQSFEGVPRFLGIDAEGREVLTFIEGDIHDYPLPKYIWSEEVLIGVAHFLRRYHDAVAKYIPPANSYWQITCPDKSQQEIICHNDIAPYNIVFRQQKPYALIDFDTAGPAPRVWDIAYAAYRFIPLSNHPKIQSFGLEQLSVQYERLVRFCAAYGSLFSPEEVIEAAIRRIEAMCSLIIKRAVTEPAFQHMIDAGDLNIYYQDIGQMLQMQHKMMFFH